jgi:aspartyl-tRNA synthetase
LYRTHTCGELRAQHIGQTATLCGWVDRIRDHKNATFIVLRDRYGSTQVVIDQAASDELKVTARALGSEYVIQAVGEVIQRGEGQANTKLATGEIELQVQSLVILNPSRNLPFLPSSTDAIGEEVRLEHRYIDLRRQSMQQTLLLRNRLTKLIRDYMDEHQFIDVETPILGRSTPEGARDYLVPSRVQENCFYALPQSPQLYKQIMMIAGYDRYYQIARCFRDEDLRADRQPEFTQLDIEMSFVDHNDVMGLIDGLMVKLAKEVLGIELQTPLPRITYDEAMRRFGHDAPDLRFAMEIVDCTDLARQSEFQVFRSVAESGKFVRGLCVPNGGTALARRRIDQLTAFVKDSYNAKGMAWAKIEDDGQWSGSVSKNLPAAEQANWNATMQAKPGDLLLWIADDWNITSKALHGLRKTLGAELKLYDPKAMHFSWVVEFPMFEHDPEEQRWVAMHHPFTAAKDEHVQYLESDPSRARAKAYDLVINGFEAGGGTIRIHDSGVQSLIFKLLGMTPEMAKDRFGFLLDALQCGAPPHGGIALGLDRVVMLFAGLDNIRDVIAFPKTQKATDMMTGAPGTVDEKQLRELRIAMVKPTKS